MNDFEISLESSSWSAWLASVSGAGVAYKATNAEHCVPAASTLDAQGDQSGQIPNIRLRPLSDRQGEDSIDQFVLRVAIGSGIGVTLSAVAYLAMTVSYGLGTLFF